MTDDDLIDELDDGEAGYSINPLHLVSAWILLGFVEIAVLSEVWVTARDLYRNWPSEWLTLAITVAYLLAFLAIGAAVPVGFYWQRQRQREMDEMTLEDDAPHGSGSGAVHEFDTDE